MHVANVTCLHKVCEGVLLMTLPLPLPQAGNRVSSAVWKDPSLSYAIVCSRSVHIGCQHLLSESRLKTTSFITDACFFPEGCRLHRHQAGNCCISGLKYGVGMCEARPPFIPAGVDQSCHETGQSRHPALKSQRLKPSPFEQNTLTCVSMHADIMNHQLQYCITV